MKYLMNCVKVQLFSAKRMRTMQRSTVQWSGRSVGCAIDVCRKCCSSTGRWKMQAEWSKSDDDDAGMGSNDETVRCGDVLDK